MRADLVQTDGRGHALLSALHQHLLELSVDVRDRGNRGEWRGDNRGRERVGGESGREWERHRDMEREGKRGRKGEG